MKFRIGFFVLITICIVFATSLQFADLVPETSADVQEVAVRNLIKRTIGDGARSFDVAIDKALGFRSFKLETKDKIISITGSDGVSAAKGFHHYLKHYLNREVTWTQSKVEIPTISEFPNVTVSSTSASAFIYYQNVCTWSYSYAWWSWSNWERHIDWMALMGISMTIAPIQENIWHEIYQKMGLTPAEISDHFAGPAFQAWQRMGNIRGWAGPLSNAYRRMQILLQKKIIKAQRELGISVALPAFAGHVPVAMKRLHPHVNFTAMERWNQFPDRYCCTLFVEPNESLFRTIAEQFLRSTIEYFGTNHIYFCDPFNEMQPRLAEPEYMQMTAFHIYESLVGVDTKAIWLLQGWMFVKNVFWTDKLIKAFLTAVPQGQMLVLDLQSEQFPQYQRTHSFHGQPFIWCMLHNFGGTLGMHGSVKTVNEHIRLARNMPNSSMIGVGITPEGIYQNYVMYMLALERGWQLEDLNLQSWFEQYADVRYGVADTRLHASWTLLQSSVYSYYGLRKLRGKYTITRRPALNLSTWTWYNVTDVHMAWQLLLEANATIAQLCYANYEHDLVDLTRQFLQALSDRLYVNLNSAYKKGQYDRVSYIANILIKLFEDLEAVLATNEHFLLGPWLENAKQMAANPAEESLFEINARNQITVWGPKGQILDYATKQWSGIVRDYYQPRWMLFLQMIMSSLKNNTKFNNTAFKEIVANEIENPFSIQTRKYPVKANGSTLEISQRIFNDWTQLLKAQEFMHKLRLFVRVL